MSARPFIYNQNTKPNPLGIKWIFPWILGDRSKHPDLVVDRFRTLPEAYEAAEKVSI